MRILRGLIVHLKLPPSIKNRLSKLCSRLGQNLGITIKEAIFTGFAYKLNLNLKHYQVNWKDNRLHGKGEEEKIS